VTDGPDSGPDVPELGAGRVRLRRLTVADAPGLYEAYGDAGSMRFWNAPPSRDVAETEDRIRRSTSVDATWYAAWAVLAKRDDAFIGMVNYHARQTWNRRLAVGWILAPRFEGQGYMAEAMRALLRHCFDGLQTHRVEAEIEPDNLRSTRLAERLGFRREGLLRDRLCVAGEPRSIWMYALLQPEWNAPCP
jgi:[ribosomal protein S5]-alanine N-acetyltransferase